MTKTFASGGFAEVQPSTVKASERVPAAPTAGQIEYTNPSIPGKTSKRMRITLALSHVELVQWDTAG